jgi:RimJ/RimL family protein N-acetyltransferase
MNQFPEIVTKHLLLRKLVMEDKASLIQYCHNEKIADQFLNIPYPYEEDAALARMNFVWNGFEKKERFVFAITLKDKNELIGEIGLHLDNSNDSAQFGYWLAEPFWGKGLITEALAAILKYGFETLGLNKIFATHYLTNLASEKVMLKNNMIKEAILKDHFKINGAYRTVNQYRLTKQEYELLHPQ